MPDPVAAVIGGGTLIGSKISADATRDAADTAAAASAPIPFDSPLYQTRFMGTGPDRRLVSSLTPMASGLLSGQLSDFRSIPLSSLTEPGFQYGQSDRDLLGRADTMFDRAGSALDLAATPEASLGFLQQAYGPQLERARAQQESRLLNQGLLGSTTGGLQTEALNRAQQQALMEGALQQQQFQGDLGQGLLGSALNTRQLFSEINLGRVANDLAERQFLGNLRQGAFSGALGLLGGAQDAAALTMRTGSPSAASQAAAMGAMGQQNFGNNIASAATAYGLNLMGMQPQQSVTPIPISRTISPAYNQGIPSAGFAGTSQIGGAGPLSFIPQ